MSYNGDLWENTHLGDIINIHNHMRVPLSSRERSLIKGKFPYYGAQGIIDYIDKYIFDGRFLLIAEDGENLRSQKENIQRLVNGKFWVNNHAHIITNTKSTTISFIYYLISYIDVKPYLTGSAQPKLNKGNLEQIPVTIPPLDTQIIISNILSSLDDKIETNNKINQQLETIAQLLYKQWFVDFEFPNQEGLPYKSSGGEMVESELGLIPKRWYVQYLDQILNFERGVEPGSKNYLEIKGLNTIPFYRVGDLRQHNPVFIDKNLADNKIVKESDVLVSFDGAIGRMGIGFKGAHSTALRNVHCKKGIHKSEYIYSLFTSELIQETMTAHANGTTILHASTSIPYLKTPYNLEAIEKFSKVIKPIYNKMLEIIKENVTLAKTRDLLLPKLMSGELRVPIEE